MPNTLRLFIASPLPALVQQTLMPFYEQRATYESAISYRVKWVVPEQWHLTWLFLGNVETEQLPIVESCFQEAVKSVKGGTITLRDIRFWPNPHKPSLIVCRAALSAGLPGIPSALQSAFNVNPKSVKAFTPHITLARIKPGSTATTGAIAQRTKPATFPAFPELETVAKSLHTIGLYQSELLPSGAVYTERYRHTFPE